MTYRILFWEYMQHWVDNVNVLIILDAFFGQGISWTRLTIVINSSHIHLLTRQCLYWLTVCYEIGKYINRKIYQNKWPYTSMLLLWYTGEPNCHSHLSIVERSLAIEQLKSTRLTSCLCLQSPTMCPLNERIILFLICSIDQWENQTSVIRWVCCESKRN